jgi:hypothetical protein
MKTAYFHKKTKTFAAPLKKIREFEDSEFVNMSRASYYL